MVRFLDGADRTRQNSPATTQQPIRWAAPSYRGFLEKPWAVIGLESYHGGDADGRRRSTPKRDSNPCRHLERALATVSTDGSCGLDPAGTGSAFGLSGLVCLNPADVEQQTE